MRRGPDTILFIVAAVIFVLAAFGVDVSDFDRLDLIALGLAAFAAGLVFCIVRGVQFWRQMKRTGGAFGAEMAKFEERSRRTERLLAEWEVANEELQLALARLRADRARLQVLTGALERAKQRTRWLRAYLPAR
jgi:hypothetical protein